MLLAFLVFGVVCVCTWCERSRVCVLASVCLLVCMCVLGESGGAGWMGGGGGGPALRHTSQNQKPSFTLCPRPPPPPPPPPDTLSLLHFEFVDVKCFRNCLVKSCLGLLLCIQKQVCQWHQQSVRGKWKTCHLFISNIICRSKKTKSDRKTYWNLVLQ